MIRSPKVVAVLLGCITLAACVGSREPRGAATPRAVRSVLSTPRAATASPQSSARASARAPDVTVDTIVTGLEAPWDVAFTPDRRIFVTERDTGRLLEIGDDGSVAEVQRFEVDAAGEGGLLGLAVSPSYRHDGLLFAYLTTSDDNRVVRFRVGDAAEPVVTGIPSEEFHNGGRIAFGPDGMLYVATGDAGREELAQDTASLAGKILRVAPSGGVPADNPFEGSLVWSLGHRNVQGLAWDEDGRLWASEYGPDRDDEINLIEAGANYGWPDVTGNAATAEFVDPELVRQPPDASWSGMALPRDPTVAQWAGSLFVASLRGERLWRVQLDGNAVRAATTMIEGEHGRLRAVVAAPDGSLWVLTNNRDGRGSPRAGDDRILRLTADARSR